jgi:hypothetical protein
MCFSARTSTKTGVSALTYAQKFCCGSPLKHLPSSNRYQSNSVCKSLIYIVFLNCFFYGQSSESLDFKGLPLTGGNLSTKLSTEKVDFGKALVNQALSVLSACSLKEVPIISRRIKVAA